jgi:ABC-2 type transport system ATP-binding protein
VQQALANQEHVLGVAQIGSSLRVLTDLREGGVEWLRDRLRAVAPQADVDTVPANLEDVFVAATRKPAQRVENAA